MTFFDDDRGADRPVDGRSPIYCVSIFRGPLSTLTRSSSLGDACEKIVCGVNKNWRNSIGCFRRARGIGESRVPRNTGRSENARRRIEGNGRNEQSNGRSKDLRCRELPRFIDPTGNRLSCGHRCAGVCTPEHLSRVSWREKRDRSLSSLALCASMMPSLQRGPAESILTPGQIDGPSSRVCLGLAALTYVPTPVSR